MDTCQKGLHRYSDGLARKQFRRCLYSHKSNSNSEGCGQTGGALLVPGCGRIIASEYWGLLYGMVDKMRSGRTDAALVRIISPAKSLEPSAERAAERCAVDFARLIIPLLGRYIPN